VFAAGYVVESVKRTVDGKVKRFQNKTPISYILAPEGSNGGGGTTPPDDGPDNQPTDGD
jgi:hypothetical protein